jgi:hypothetical protein
MTEGGTMDDDDSAQRLVVSARTSLLRPGPTGDQRVPFHWAMPLAAMPPAVEKSPPAYTVLPDTARAYTEPFIPEPIGNQLLPFQCAM